MLKRKTTGCVTHVKESRARYQLPAVSDQLFKDEILDAGY
jgi:hypothetical protein